VVVIAVMGAKSFIEIYKRRKVANTIISDVDVLKIADGHILVATTFFRLSQQGHFESDRKYIEERH